MNRKIAILGAGAIGCSVGADLAKAGYDTALIDHWPAHVDAMKSGGLHINMPHESVHAQVRAYHLCEVCSLNMQFDIVLLAAKSYDSCWMAEFIKPYLKPDGVLVSLQNSMNDEWIAPIIGLTRDIGCVVELSAEMFTPGLVRRNTTRAGTWFGLGELHGQITPRLTELQTMMSHVGKASVTANISGAKWTKLLANTMLLGPVGILGLYEWEAVEIPAFFEVAIRIGRETLAVGTALGYRIEAIYGLRPEEFMGSDDQILEKNVRTLVSHIGKYSRNCVLQDHLKSRLSEVDYLNGLVVKKGKEANVRTPLNEAVTKITHQIRCGALKPDRANLALLQKIDC